ncbi:Crp/Fnr family transcriptional regulator [Fibrella sp. WM1]|uniref:Crp/Fnr family transcriptional regulator n=1 Tax=Fibrella musci TaxID=3242485 RepID=UPI00352290DA
MHQFDTFIAQYVSLATDSLETVKQHVTIRHVSKGRFYLQSGQVNGEFAFIQQGSLRISHTTPAGDDLTGWLAVEGQSFCDLASFRDQRPTRFAVQALTDTTLLVISHADMQHLYQTVPGWQEFGRKLWEDISVQLIEMIVSFQGQPAEVRYERLSRDNTLLQSAPLKYIAEFLGITPYTLSRIRRKR